MRAYYHDTDPKIEQMQIELLREMSSWKKFALIDDLYETVRALAISGIKQRYPEATPDLVRRMLADLLPGPELAMKVYGPHMEIMK